MGREESREAGILARGRCVCLASLFSPLALFITAVTWQIRRRNLKRRAGRTKGGGKSDDVVRGREIRELGFGRIGQDRTNRLSLGQFGNGVMPMNACVFALGMKWAKRGGRANASEGQERGGGVRQVATARKGNVCSRPGPWSHVVSAAAPLTKLLLFRAKVGSQG